MLQTVAGSPAAIVTFLSGYALRKPQPEHCRELGAALARLHEAGLTFPMKRANALSVAGWEKLVRGNRRSGRRAEAGDGG